MYDYVSYVNTCITKLFHKGDDSRRQTKYGVTWEFL